MFFLSIAVFPGPRIVSSIYMSKLVSHVKASLWALSNPTTHSTSHLALQWRLKLNKGQTELLVFSRNVVPTLLGLFFSSTSNPGSQSWILSYPQHTFIQSIRNSFVLPSKIHLKCDQFSTCQSLQLVQATVPGCCSGLWFYPLPPPLTLWSSLHKAVSELFKA